MAIRTPVDQHKFTPAQMASDSFDREFRNYTVEMLGYDGSNLQRARVDSAGNIVSSSVNYAYKITEDGTLTYVGRAAVGTTEDEALWQAFLMDDTSGLRITWADGDDNFDNVATDLTALSYS